MMRRTGNGKHVGMMMMEMQWILLGVAHVIAGFILVVKTKVLAIALMV